MLNWWQILNALFLYTWLFLVLFFLWRHAIGGSHRYHTLQRMLYDIAEKNAESAKMAAEAARLLAEAHNAHSP